MIEWHVITCEYPPQLGGVSDYTEQIADGLAEAGDRVHVWCPAMTSEEREFPGVVVHRELGRFSPSDLRRFGRMLDQFSRPRRLLIQWVPQGYGYRSMNLCLCLKLWERARRKDDHIEIMVHEPFLGFGEGSRKQDLAAAIHRIMVVILLRAASRIWVSIPNWEVHLRPFNFGPQKPFCWLPVPSNILPVEDPDRVATVRARFVSTRGLLIGHFGAYDHYMIGLMLEMLPRLLSGPESHSIMLLGKGSQELRDRLMGKCPKLGTHVRATGTLDAEDISLHLQSCDVMLQPYQDGVSGRRGSSMAALAHGLPIVTNIGKATENCWADSRAVALTNVGDVSAMVESTQALLADANERSRLSAAARKLYDERFDIKRVIATLRDSA